MTFVTLRCIIEGLDNCVMWPDVEERANIAKETTGIMENCVGILDCIEHVIRRPNDLQKNRNRYSGNIEKHSMKTIAVIDKSGYFRFVQTVLMELATTGISSPALACACNEASSLLLAKLLLLMVGLLVMGHCSILTMMSMATAPRKCSILLLDTTANLWNVFRQNTNMGPNFGKSQELLELQ